MIFICEDCDSTFDHPKWDPVWIDDQFGGHREYEAHCPNCGSVEYDEAIECTLCGRMVAERKLYDGLCPACIRKRITGGNV